MSDKHTSGTKRRANPNLATDPSKLVDHGFGAIREDKRGKGRFDLIPPCALRRLALHYEAGAELHGDRNWEKGLSASGTLNSLLRHGQDYLAGDRKEDHLAAIMWNAAALMFFEEFRPECMDLPLPTPLFKGRKKKCT